MFKGKEEEEKVVTISEVVLLFFSPWRILSPLLCPSCPRHMAPFCAQCLHHSILWQKLSHSPGQWSGGSKSIMCCLKDGMNMNTVLCLFFFTSGLTLHVIYIVCALPHPFRSHATKSWPKQGNNTRQANQYYTIVPIHQFLLFILFFVYFLWPPHFFKPRVPRANRLLRVRLSDGLWRRLPIAHGTDVRGSARHEAGKVGKTRGWRKWWWEVGDMW